MSTGRILVASSQAHSRGELKTVLETEGHQVTETASFEETMRRTCSGLHDLLVVDSRVDGVELCELCRAIRPRSHLGILILAGDDARQSRINTLNAGADEFVAVPFVLVELLARIRALLRRVTPPDERHQIVLQDREVNLRSHEVKGPGNRVSHLTPKEYHVLQYLIAHANKPRTAQSLAQCIWQKDGGGDLEYVRVVIRQLRHKIEPDPYKPRYILTDRSAGYRFQISPAVGQASTAHLIDSCSAT